MRLSTYDNKLATQKKKKTPLLNDSRRLSSDHIIRVRIFVKRPISNRKILMEVKVN